MSCADAYATRVHPTFLKTHLGNRRFHVCHDRIHALDSLLHLYARLALDLQHGRTRLLPMIAHTLHYLLLRFLLDFVVNTLATSLQLFDDLSNPIPTSNLMLYFTNIVLDAGLHIIVLPR